jgi:signal peptidase
MSFQSQELLIPASLAADREIQDRIGCELIAEALRAGAHTRVRVMGTSMLPALWPGDILVVRGGLPATLSVGDIVLFLRYGRLFAHRVVRKSGAELITRGDALSYRDPPVQASELLGLVVQITREGAGQFPARSLSITQRIAALAIRRSETVYRMVLRWHRAQSSGRYLK